MCLFEVSKFSSCGLAEMAKKKVEDKSEESSKNNEVDTVGDGEEPNFSDPEGFVDDISDSGKL